VANDPLVLFLSSREIPGGIHEGDQGDIETVARADESGGLIRGIAVDGPGLDMG
jgi:hypothetical protein